MPYPDPNRFFGLRWYVNGKPKEQTSGTRNRREAERAALVLEEHLNTFGDGGRISWRDFRTRYETECLAFLSESSQGGWRTAANHLERLLSPSRLSDVDAQGLSRLTGMLIREGKSANSAKSYIVTIRVALNWAWKISLIKNQVPPGWIPPTQRGESEMRSRPITAEEFDRIIAVAPKVRPRDYATWQNFIRGLWHSGLRIDELRRLHWSINHGLSIDESHRYPMLRILKQKNRKVQFAPITPAFWQLLKDGPKVGYVFKLPARRGDQMTRKAATRVVNDIGAKSGVITEPDSGKTATSHDIGRRAFLDRLVKEGYSEEQARQYARHSSAETTRRYYLLQDAERLAEQLGWS